MARRTACSLRNTELRPLRPGHPDNFLGSGFSPAELEEIYKTGAIALGWTEHKPIRDGCSIRSDGGRAEPALKLGAEALAAGLTDQLTTIQPLADAQRRASDRCAGRYNDSAFGFARPKCQSESAMS